MSKLCCCMVVVLALTTFAVAGDMTTRSFLHQVMMSGLAAEKTEPKDTKAGETKQENKGKSESTERKEVSKETRREKSIQFTSKAKQRNVKGLDALDMSLKELILKDLLTKDTRTVEDVREMAQGDAVDVIEKAGLKVGKITFEYSEDVSPGNVIRQEPKGGKQEEAGSQVDLVIAQTEIAIEPFKLHLDKSVNEIVRGQRIVHRAYDVQLGEVGNYKVRQVPMFTILSDGVHNNLSETDYNLLEARAKSIAERLLTAWDLMDQGADVKIVAEDDLAKWHIRGPYAPQYPENQETGGSNKERVHIDVVPKAPGGHPLRIMTVYPADAVSYGSPVGADENGNPLNDRGPLSSRELAEYIGGVIEVHHILFCQKNVDHKDFQGLEFDKVRISEVLLYNVLTAAKSMADAEGSPVERKHLRRALASIARSDLADELDRLSRIVPVDWRVRDKYGKY